MAQLPSKMRVKNRSPAAIQITAEQLLREAHDRGGSVKKHVPRSQITDPEELREYRMIKRKDFEDAIRMNRVHIGNYVKYAKWEEQQEEFERARSVFERAIDIDHRSTSLWLKYAEMEMRNKFVNHARNVWDRAVTLLPRSQLWYKYTYMEEMLENFAVARSIFERWMRWEPEEQAWFAYVKFEERRGDMERARGVLERLIACHPTVQTYLKYARWERQAPRARQIYERALTELAEWEQDEKLYVAFAKFEESQKEYERARAILKFAGLSLLEFEKKHGGKSSIQAELLEKRREEYEKRLDEAPEDYDAWFDLIHLVEELSTPDDVRETFERAVAVVPPAEKRYWRRYVYVWLEYAVYEEFRDDMERARAVYRTALGIIPHKKFTFGKVWLQAAEFEIRRKDLRAARKLLGEAIGKCPKPKLFKGYLRLERMLGEVERCRTISAKFVEFSPSSAASWIRFSEFEAAIGEVDRARAIFDLAVDQPSLDLPELVWKAYIDLEIRVERGEVDAEEEASSSSPRKAADLYERLLERTKHVKVWLSYAKYQEKDPAAARAIMERADEHLKLEDLKDERVLLLDAWQDMELRFGDEDNLAKVRALIPRKVKKRRQAQDGSWEEVYDYVFPDDKKAPLNLKILEMAKKWKQEQQQQKKQRVS
ncbi:hypothetical protein CTAYLR_002564 [Chrysophaeum taylorii]|uniref:Pre-mRNA-splicing factor Syf1-like N-terminal HAT-repeats domain-containing protein n=1 Tax=Chrysophaeum taylorii TaxID=2483200 RepID=A0AAD7UGZ5_9STRA|nr:hypothetical protein CTAYLR_002564 [Chrysophaeum taylorii]